MMILTVVFTVGLMLSIGVGVGVAITVVALEKRVEKLEASSKP